MTKKEIQNQLVVLLISKTKIDRFSDIKNPKLSAGTYLILENGVFSMVTGTDIENLDSNAAPVVYNGKPVLDVVEATLKSLINDTVEYAPKGTLFDKSLNGIDPTDKNLSNEMKERIVKECISNPRYVLDTSEMYDFKPYTSDTETQANTPEQSTDTSNTETQANTSEQSTNVPNTDTPVVPSTKTITYVNVVKEDIKNDSVIGLKDGLVLDMSTSSILNKDNMNTTGGCFVGEKIDIIRTSITDEEILNEIERVLGDNLPTWF